MKADKVELHLYNAVSDRWLVVVLGLVSSWSQVQSGIVKKLYVLVDTIFALTLLLNSSTCFLMYIRNASLHQRPCSIMVYVLTSFRSIAMSMPDQIKCRPILSAVKPR